MISFIVACYNEEKNITETINSIILANRKLKDKKYEIIIIDDHSTDNSKNILNKLKKKFKFIKLKKNKKNLGYGGTVKVGIKKAKGDYIIWIPGDNSHASSELVKILKYKNKYDIVSTFYTNTETRSRFRNNFTKFYTPILNILFGLNLPYYNGVTLIKKKIFSKFNIVTNSHSFHLEIWVNIFLINKYSIKFVPTLLNDRIKGATAFKFKNSIKVLFNFLRLYFYFLFKKFKTF